MSRRKRAPSAPPPRRDCPACEGTGFIRLAAAPNRTGVDGRQISYAAPLQRCECAQNRAQGFIEPKAAKLDQAQRAAGEREE